MFCRRKRLSPESFRQLLWMIAGIAVFCGLTMPTYAQETPPVNVLDEPLIVGVYDDPPFVIAADDRTWDGLSVQLWREIAEELNIDYEF